MPTWSGLYTILYMNRERILVSACLAGIPCRYDGTARTVPYIEDLYRRGLAVPVCPETAGGLPVPRRPSEIRDGRVYHNDGTDVTENFIRGSQECLRICMGNGCVKAVLKSKSPACGKGTVYSGDFSGTLREGNGIFAQMLEDSGIEVMTEEEACLK